MTPIQDETTRLREQGQAALQRADPAAAEIAFHALLHIDAAEIYGLVGLGLAARLRGARDAAMRLFEQAAAAHPWHTWPLLEIGAEHSAAGQPDAAEAALRRALDINPRDYHCMIGLGRLLRSRGDNAAAIELFRAAAAHRPDEATALAELAATLAALGQADEALAAYRTLASRGDVAKAQRRDAAFAGYRFARAQNQPSRAMELLEQAASLDPADIEVQCEVATRYRAANRLPESETAYRRVLRLAPGNLAALGGLAIVRRQSGDGETALALLTQASAIDAHNEWIRLELALTCRGLGRLDEAGALLETIEPGPGIYVWARMSLGHMARARGEPRWAAVYFGQAARHAADPTEALCQIVAAHAARADYGAAEAALSRAFAQSPDAYQVHMAHGYLRRAMADAAGARKAFRRAADADPGQAQALVELAAEASELGDFAAAAEAVDSALRLEPLHETALLQRAAWLAESGDSEAALAAYAALRAARPDAVSAYIAAAQLLADLGEAAAGLDVLTAAARACPASAQTGLRHAGILRQSGLQDEAYRVLVETQTRFGRELTPWCHLAAAAIDMGRFAEVETLLEAPPQAEGKAAARISVLRAQLDKARWCLDAAIAHFSAAIALDPSDSQAVYERAKLRLVTFDIAGARADLTAHSVLRRASARREGRSANPSQTHAGQLYEEFILEPGLAAKLAAVRGDVAALAAIVRHHPSATAASIGLMIALRRGAWLETPPPDDANALAIPLTLAQFWDEAEPPPDVGALMRSWRDVNPHFSVEVFDTARAAAYVRGHCGAAVARAFDLAAEPAQRADIFRLAWLYHEGGFYADADDRARNDLAACVPAGATFFAHQEDFGSVGNNVIGAARGHPVVEAALRGAVDAVLRGDRDIVWLSTGPGLLTRALAVWLAADPDTIKTQLNRVAILTLVEMRRAVAMHCHAAYKTTNRAWLNSAFPQRRRA